MQLFQKFNITLPQLLKMLAVIAAALVVFAFVVNLLGLNDRYHTLSGSRESVGTYQSEKATYSSGAAAPAVDLTYDGTIRPEPDYIPGPDAEAYEVTTYRGTIETRHLAEDCAVLSGLKARTEVVFLHAASGDRFCTYTFKVLNTHAAEVRTIIESLNPDTLTADTVTLQKQLEYFENEIDILREKQAVIDQTLQDATVSYDRIATLATTIEDVESLTKIIENKLNTIERLTQQKIQVSNRLAALSRSQAAALDQLTYTQFTISVTEAVFVDTKTLSDSWKRKTQEVIHAVNETLEQMTLGLISFLFTLLQYVLYFVILLFLARAGWHFVYNVWQQPRKQERTQTTEHTE